MLTTILILVAVTIFYIVIHRLSKSIFILKHTFKIISLAFAVFIIAIIIGAFYVVSDANNFRTHFFNSTNLFLLENNSKFITGVEISANSKNQYNTLSTDKLTSLEKEYKNDNINGLREGYYKVFVINIVALDGIKSFKMTDQNINIDLEQAKKILLSNTPKDDLAIIESTQNNLSSQTIKNSISISDEQLKGYVFSYYITNILNPENFQNLVNDLKDNKIHIYENTALFKALKLIPAFIMNDLMSKDYISSAANSTLNLMNS